MRNETEDGSRTGYDAVVVGAGHNGLASAIHLAAKGWKVLVVEGNAEPGGAVKTREVTLPGYRHDLCAMNLSMFAGSAFFAQYKNELIAHGLALLPAVDCFASVFRDNTYLGVSTDLEKTARAIGALSPEDALAWRTLLAEFHADAPYIFGLLGSPMPSWAAVKVIWNAWRAKGSGWLYDTARLLFASPRNFLDARFQNTKLKTMMAAWGLHLDFPPDVAGGALFPYLESMTSQAFGMMIGQGGADTIIKAMTGLLRAKGGELLLGSPVEKIDVTNGKASGVRLVNGQCIKAARAVIANVHPKILVERLVPADPQRAVFDRKVQKFRAGPGTMMLHLALSDLPDWIAGAELKKFAYVHIAPDLKMMSQVYAEAAAGLLPVEPALVIGQPTAVDHSRAPTGRHVLWVQVRVLPAQFHGDAADQIRAHNWEEAKEAYADRVVDIMDRYAPGLRTRILGRCVFSPTDLERENPNLVGGDNLSGSHHLDQNFLFRPVPGYSRYSTPIRALYICGASTWPGAGTGAGSGFMLAKMLAKW